MNPPANAVILSRDYFERLAFAHHVPVSLPGPEGGWATMRLEEEGDEFATLLPPVSDRVRALCGEASA